MFQWLSDIGEFAKAWKASLLGESMEVYAQPLSSDRAERQRQFEETSRITESVKQGAANAETAMVTVADLASARLPVKVLGKMGGKVLGKSLANKVALGSGFGMQTVANGILAERGEAPLRGVFVAAQEWAGWSDPHARDTRNGGTGETGNPTLGEYVRGAVSPLKYAYDEVSNGVAYLKGSPEPQENVAPSAAPNPSNAAPQNRNAEPASRSAATSAPQGNLLESFMEFIGRIVENIKSLFGGKAEVDSAASQERTPNKVAMNERSNQAAGQDMAVVTPSVPMRANQELGRV